MASTMISYDPVAFGSQPASGELHPEGGTGQGLFITRELIRIYLDHLADSGKSQNTLKKYSADLEKFLQFVGDGAELNIAKTNSYKSYLLERTRSMNKNGSPVSYSSINSQITPVNSMLNFFHRRDLSVKLFASQKKTFQGNQLSDQHVRTLVRTAKEQKNHRLSLIILTIASCGIRISELSSITVEAIGKKEVQVINKGKARIILLPGDLKKLLKNYCKDKKITSGPIFITRNGKPMDRSNIWKEMKTLSVKASVPSDLVFPHNFRHYFARNYYSNEKDIAGLSNLLGHSSLNTTMIYVKESVEEATRKVDRAGNRILKAYIYGVI